MGRLLHERDLRNKNRKLKLTATTFKSQFFSQFKKIRKSCRDIYPKNLN